MVLLIDALFFLIVKYILKKISQQLEIIRLPLKITDTFHINYMKVVLLKYTNVFWKVYSYAY